MRLKLLSCEILYREMCAVVARSPHQVDVEFLPKGLHDIAGAGMCERLQAAVDKVDASLYEAVLLGYALCGNGVVGLTARAIPLVLPRGHDCITLFLGSRRRYEEYFQNHPGVYFKTTGWIERGLNLEQLGLTRQKTGVGMSYAELAARYGEDNAQYLWEQLGGYTKNYRKLTYIEMGIEPDNRFELQTRREAAERNMEFEKISGDMRLFEKLVSGDWDPEEFLVVPPGHRIIARYDEAIVGFEPAP
jgi:hypothetical protein